MDLPSEAMAPLDCQMAPCMFDPVSVVHNNWARVLVEMLEIQPL